MVKLQQPQITNTLYSTQPVLPDHNKSRAQSGSLGLFSFAFTSLVAGIVQISTPEADAGVLAGVAIFYGGATQFIVGLQEHNQGNSFSGTVFSSYGALWIAKGLIWIIAGQLYAAYDNDRSLVRQQLGIIEGVSAGLTITLCGISVNLKSGSRLLTGILAAVVVYQTLQTVAICGGDTTVAKIAGVFLVLAAAGAWYGAVAELVLEDGILLPVGAHNDVASHPHPADKRDSLHIS